MFKERRILIWFLLLILILSHGIKAAKADNIHLAFPESDEFSILIVADTQDTEHPQQAMLDLLNASLDHSSPDLVVFAGDMIHGPSVHGIANIKKAIDAIVQPVVQKNIPFTVVFGNHDSQCGLSNEELLTIFQSYPGCLAVEGNDLPGCGNYYCLLENPKNPDSPIALWFLDSGSYAEEGKGTYGYVTEAQNEWMLHEYNALCEQHKSPVSYVFQHIPIPQAYSLLNEVSFGTPGAITCYGPNFMKWYTPKEDLVWAGKFGEAPCSSEYDSGEFDTWKKMNVKAAFFGHDHLNDYCGTYDGIDLIATSGIGFYLYGRGDEHGARVVTFFASSPDSYQTRMLYYKDIVSSPLPGLFVSTLGVLIQNYVFLGAAALVLVIAFVVFIVRRIRKRRKKHA